MNVTNVRVKKIENKNRLKAVATITFDECFVIHELRLIEGTNGLFVAMPSKRNAQGEFRDVCHPITKELRQQIEEVVITEYNQIEDEILVETKEETQATVEEESIEENE